MQTVCNELSSPLRVNSQAARRAPREPKPSATAPANLVSSVLAPESRPVYPRYLHDLQGRDGGEVVACDDFRRAFAAEDWFGF